MTEAKRVANQETELLNEIEHLRQEVVRLRQMNSDLEIALLTTTEHGDLIEAQLHESNQRLQAEIAERRLAQGTLQEILETVSKDKADLEIMLEATAKHGDVLEYQLYTQAVETMRQSEELFRAISESTSILMILTQRSNGSIAYANSVSGERLGLDVQTLVGQRLDDFFADFADRQKIRDMMETQGFVRNYEMQVKRKDKSLFWVSASVHPLCLAGEQTLLTTLYDISDRKYAEEIVRQSEEKLRQQAQDLELRVDQRTAELQQAEEKYRSIFENAAEGIFQATPDGRYISANPALADIYGYDSPEDLIKSVKNIGQQIYAQPRRRDELIAYLNRFGSVDGFESKVYCKEGTIIWISENVRIVRDADGNLVHYEGSVRNITDRKSAEEELRRQRLMSERLLLNVLPQPIAERLKRGEKTIADSFSDVAVLFADIVGFTALSSHVSPTELIELLNDIFSAFDKLADQHGLEKIKTIGDAYMVVGGLPQPSPDNLSSIADMALDMLQEVKRFTTPSHHPIPLRIGIHSGPVVAGVIGTRKFIYDLWGDTVNVASRMEAQGETNRIQVTQVIYDRLQKRYEFEKRGEIDIKGKGLMSTYWLLDRRFRLSRNSQTQPEVETSPAISDS
ncbi:MAG: PAS domain S-box protein [Scytolyngbya sp. HA4215-MV1]|jgi:PAS domain S-box-containing protein|nr:PAS domain S-box protein [Scytolyngbya sp. HA4215-MV1]